MFVDKKAAPQGVCINRNGDKYVEEYYAGSVPEEQRQFVRNVPLRLTIENLAQELKDELENCNSDLVNENNIQGPHADVEPPDYAELPALERQRRYQYMKYQVNRTNEEIMSALKKIIDRYEKDDTAEALIYEWRQVAVGVDRILFWIFLAGTLLSTIAVLIVAPMTNKWRRGYELYWGSVFTICIHIFVIVISRHNLRWILQFSRVQVNCHKLDIGLCCIMSFPVVLWDTEYVTKEGFSRLVV